MRTLAAAAVLLTLAACGDNIDGEHFEPWELPDLTAAEGVTVRTPEFDVAAGEELQDCYFFQVPDLADGEPLWIDRTVLALNPGSHHMNVFRVGELRDLDPSDGDAIDLGGVQGTVIRAGECWKSGNWANWPLVVNSQQSNPDEPVLDWRLPDDVAYRLEPGEMLMLQVHFVNATTQATPWKGRAAVNFHRSQDGDSQELGTLFATQQSIRICRSSPPPTYSGACRLPAGAHTVAAANGHFHSRGRRFQMFAWDGVSTDVPGDDARFYESDDWAEPDMALNLDVPIADGGGVWWSCDFEWTEPEVGCDVVNERDPQGANDCCYTFGPIVEASEHCNVFAYYYPKTAGDIACF
jgi:hypothetical protein